MRTSRISQDTSKIITATSLSPKPRRSTRSSLSRFNHDSIKDEDDQAAQSLQESTDIEDVVPSSRKRKREPTVRTPIKKMPQNSLAIKTEVEDNITFSPAPDRRVRKPARQIKNEATGDVEIHPPNDWAEVYAVVKEMRISGPARNAAVDTMGCERLAEDTASPKDKRFQTLIALMLSSQTKDTTNSIAMKRLQTQLPAYKAGAPVGLNLENILAVDPKLLNELIWVVGFHNNKTKYIKAAAEILRDQWNGDIPDTIEGLMSLPGVGPKMAYLCMSVAWGRTEGIGVDVHVHRITNLWGWHKTKGPEETRLVLQAWLPRELWHEINWLLVGLGQSVCLPVGRKCGECDLGLGGLCKAAERSKVTIGRKIREERIKLEGENIVEKTETVKLEEDSQVVPVSTDPESGAGFKGSADVTSTKEEKIVLDEIANAPAKIRKTSTRKGRR